MGNTGGAFIVFLGESQPRNTFKFASSQRGKLRGGNPEMKIPRLWQAR